MRISDWSSDVCSSDLPQTHAVKRYPLPGERGNANLNTATFDGNGKLWFTGQNGIYGRVDPDTGKVDVWDAPRGRGPYGIATTPSGQVWYASLAGNHIARIDTESGKATVVESPTPGQGARRVWPDSHGRLWGSDERKGQPSRYEPATGKRQARKLRRDQPGADAGHVDGADKVTGTDFGAHAE